MDLKPFMRQARYAASQGSTNVTLSSNIIRKQTFASQVNVGFFVDSFLLIKPGNQTKICRSDFGPISVTHENNS